MTEYGTFYLSCFNPRLRTGGDDRTPKAASILLSFNPRLRTGGDVAEAQGFGCGHVSIHASAREATRAGRHGPDHR